jgi:hypothetical protein
LAGTPDRLKAAVADRYAVQRELGQGGMATVYLADDLKHQRRVAVVDRGSGASVGTGVVTCADGPNLPP